MLNQELKKIYYLAKKASSLDPKLDCEEKKSKLKKIRNSQLIILERIKSLPEYIELQEKKQAREKVAEKIANDTAENIFLNNEIERVKFKEIKHELCNIMYEDEHGRLITIIRIGTAKNNFLRKCRANVRRILNSHSVLNPEIPELFYRRIVKYSKNRIEGCKSVEDYRNLIIQGVLFSKKNAMFRWILGKCISFDGVTWYDLS